METGRFLEVGVAVEAVRGTAETSASRWAKHVETNVISRTEKVVDDNVRGVLEDSEGARVVREWFDGDLSGILHVDLVGYLALNIYGSVVSSSLGSGAYSHAFSVEQSIEHPTLTIFRKDGVIDSVKYAGAVVSTLEISASTDDYVRFTANLIAKSESAHALTPSYAVEYDFIGKDITIKLADTEGGLAGASETKVKSVAVKYDLGAITDYVLGNENPDGIYNAKKAIEIEFTKNFEDTTFEDLFKSDTYKYMSITIEGDADIGGGAKPKMTWIFNRVQVQDWERAGGQDALVEETVTLKAFYNQTDGEQDTLTIQNKTASYAIGS